MKLLIFVGLNVGGYIGWELGEPYGIMAAFLVSSLGSAVGGDRWMEAGSALFGVEIAPDTSRCLLQEK